MIHIFIDSPAPLPQLAAQLSSLLALELITRSADGTSHRDLQQEVELCEHLLWDDGELGIPVSQYPYVLTAQGGSPARQQELSYEWFTLLQSLAGCSAMIAELSPVQSQALSTGTILQPTVSPAPRAKSTAPEAWSFHEGGAESALDPLDAEELSSLADDLESSPPAS